MWNRRWTRWWCPRPQRVHRRLDGSDLIETAKAYGDTPIDMVGNDGALRRQRVGQPGGLAPPRDGPADEQLLGRSSADGRRADAVQYFIVRRVAVHSCSPTRWSTWRS